MSFTDAEIKILAHYRAWSVLCDLAVIGISPDDNPALTEIEFEALAVEVGTIATMLERLLTACERMYGVKAADVARRAEVTS